MKRLLKHPLHNLLSFPHFIHRSPPPKPHRRSGLYQRLLQSALMMAAVGGATVGGLVCPERAQAASLVWSNNTVVWPVQNPPSLTQTYRVTTANGGSVNVRFIWSGATGTITRLDNSSAAQFPVTGGFPDPGPNANSLASSFDPNNTNQEITVTIQFIDNEGNLIPVENVDFTIFDIDRDDADGWQDVVTVNGSLGGVPVPPALSLPPGSITVNLLGNVATGIAPTPGQEANNQTGEGNLAITYPSGVDTLIYTYGNGPDSPVNPANHGIALSNLNFDPAIIGLAKSAGTPVLNADGTFTVPYTLTVVNLGETQLNNVQITEDLTTTFANTNGFTVSNVQSPSLTVNPNFNGNTITTVLQGGDTLAPGQTRIVTFDVAITPGDQANGGLGPFNNTAVVTATTPSGAPVTDDSTDDPNVPPGAPGDPDPNDDGDPIERVPTVVNLPTVPIIGVAKRVANVIDNGNNNFDITYELVVENLGNVPLENVQVTEDLTPTFAGAVGFNVTSVSTGGAPLTANLGFNGSTEQALLAGTDTLAVGASQTISFVVNVDTGGNSGPFENTAVATGSNDGVTVTDLSDDGTDPDPNPNDGNPGGGPDENDPTPVSLVSSPIIGVAKRVANVVDNGNDSYDVTYELVVENLGNVSLDNVQVTENLNSTFTGVTSFNVTNVATGGAPLTPNLGFDGTTDFNLLAGTDTLAVGASQTISFVVNVNTGGNRGPFENIAVASGSNGSTTVTDQSDDGIDPDPNPNDGNPGGGPGENDPTPISLPPEATIQLIKRITTIIQGDNPPTVFNELDDNPPNPSFVGQRIVDPVLSSGDVVEYTIYFLNNGFVTASLVEICDPIPPPTDFVVDGFATGQGIQFDPPGAPTTITLTNGSDGDTGRFISPLTPLSACPNDTAGDQGAVVVNVGSVQPGEFGFVRFRTSIP